MSGDAAVVITLAFTDSLSIERLFGQCPPMYMLETSLERLAGRDRWQQQGRIIRFSYRSRTQLFHCEMGVIPTFW